MGTDELIGIGLGGASAIGQAIYGQHQAQQNQQQQVKDQKELMEFSNNLAYQNWIRTNYSAQVEQMEKAGLNVGLMYGKGGGAGGTLQGSSGNASKADTIPIDISNAITQNRAIESQIKVNEAQANLLKTEAQNIAEKTTTEVNSRDIMIENMKQSGIAQWFENMKTEMMRNGVSENEMEVKMFRNAVYGKSAAGYDITSPEVKKFNADLAKTVAEEKNLDASALLTNEKAMGYWQELLIATKNADANMINAKANELAKEWETGEFTNWRTWVEIAKDATGVATDLIKAGKTPKTLGKK